MVFVARNQATKVVKPSEAGVRFSIFADSVSTGVGPGWCVCGGPDGERSVRSLAAAGAHPEDRSRRPDPRSGVAVFPGGSAAGEFLRRASFPTEKHGQCERRQEEHGGRPRPRFWSLGHAEWDRQRSPLFRAAEAGVEEGLRDIQASSVSQVFGQHFQDASQGCMAHPAWKTPMAGWVGRIAVGKVLPGGSCAQHPQHPMQHLTTVSPRSPTAIRPALLSVLAQTRLPADE